MGLTAFGLNTHTCALPRGPHVTLFLPGVLQVCTMAIAVLVNHFSCPPSLLLAVALGAGVGAEWKVSSCLLKPRP